MAKLTRKREQRYWILSGILFIIMIVVASYFYLPALQHIIVEATTPDDISYLLSIRDVITFSEFFDLIDVTILTVLALIIIPAWAYHSDRKWRDNIDDNIPPLLREISDAQKTGLPLPRAILEASKHQYGALTPELGKMAAKISWGIPFGKALRSLTVTADTSLMKRTSVLILEAERSGGAIEDVFESAHNHVSEVLGLKRERLGSMKPYRWIIFASFIVFAIVMIILLISFFQQLATQNVDAIANDQQASASLPFNVAGIQLLFFHLMVIEAIFAGLIAGKMGQGDAKLGLRDSCFLLGICYVFFKLAVVLA
ncbi:MAG: type II secretion system F family protein [Candidatus Hodarchaeales archaeon]|jgi:flagellar protein FlaJ